MTVLVILMAIVVEIVGVIQVVIVEMEEAVMGVVETEVVINCKLKNKYKMFGLFKRKELIDREVDLYKREKFFEIDKQLEDYLLKRQSEMVDMAKKCHEQLGVYEHNFHQTKEIRGIEL